VAAPIKRLGPVSSARSLKKACSGFCPELALVHQASNLSEGYTTMQANGDGEGILEALQEPRALTLVTKP